MTHGVYCWLYVLQCWQHATWKASEQTTRGQHQAVGLFKLHTTQPWRRQRHNQNKSFIRWRTASSASTAAAAHAMYTQITLRDKRIRIETFYWCGDVMTSYITNLHIITARLWGLTRKQCMDCLKHYNIHTNHFCCNLYKAIYVHAPRMSNSTICDNTQLARMYMYTSIAVHVRCCYVNRQTIIDYVSHQNTYMYARITNFSEKKLLIAIWCLWWM